MAKKRQRKKRALARLGAEAVQTSLFEESKASLLERYRIRFAYRPTQVPPPVNFDLILYLLMSPADCEALIGDLEELYQNLVERLGERRADLWYAKQVLTSVWPLLSSSIRRLGNSAVVNALCLALRFCGLGGMADDLKQLSVAKQKQK